MHKFKHLTETALYIHIPFCRSKCFYCDFFSVVERDPELMHSVISETIRQGAYFYKQLGDPVVASVYVGGGTPSSLPPGELERLFGFIGKLHLAPNGCEFTVEANPESLTAAFLRSCRDAGVNRLSVGIQSCQAEQLQLLGRLATPELNRQALDLLKSDWQGRLNLDLITGLPRQNAAGAREDLLRVLRNQPGHLSLYSLTIEHGTDLEQQITRGELLLAPEADRDDIWFEAADFLREQGYTDYEISNFCLPGEECRHNLSYWELRPYLGLGAGAVSTLPVAGPRGTEVVRLQNPCSLTDFLVGAEANWGIAPETISLPDFLIENLMMGFRLKSGLAATLFRKRFQADLPALLKECWSAWQAAGYLPAGEPGAYYRLTDRGRLFLNTLLADVIGAKEELAQALAGSALDWP